MNTVIQTIAGCLGIVLEIYGHDPIIVQQHMFPLLNLAEVQVPTQYVEEGCNVDSLPEVQQWLIEKTQEKFYARNGGERWIQPVPQWITKSPDEAFEHFMGLGLMNKTYPKAYKFECAAIFGSTAPHMQKTIIGLAERLAAQEVEVDQVFLLTGERYADKNVDGGDEYVVRVADKNGVPPHKVTETMLMEDAYKSVVANHPDLGKLPVTTIDTPREDKPRPTTVSTIVHFLNSIPADVCKTVIFISRAPYTLAQAEDTKRIMQAKSPSRYFEIVGGAVTLSEAQSKQRGVYHMSMALAGSFYGGRDRVLREITAHYLMCPWHDSHFESQT